MCYFVRAEHKLINPMLSEMSSNPVHLLLDEIKRCQSWRSHKIDSEALTFHLCQSFQCASNRKKVLIESGGVNAQTWFVAAFSHNTPPFVIRIIAIDGRVVVKVSVKSFVQIDDNT